MGESVDSEMSGTLADLLEVARNGSHPVNRYKLVLYLEDGMFWVRRGEAPIPHDQVPAATQQSSDRKPLSNVEVARLAYEFDAFEDDDGLQLRAFVAGVHAAQEAHGIK